MYDKYSSILKVREKMMIRQHIYCLKEM